MKLNLETLKERAEAVASTDLLATISGGTENACHVRIKCDDCTVTIKGGTITIQN